MGAGSSSEGGMGGFGGRGGLDASGRSAGERSASARNSFGSLGSGLSANSRSNSSGRSSLGIGGASGRGLGSNLSSTGSATSNTSVGNNSGTTASQLGRNLSVTAPSVSAKAPKFAGEQLASLPSPSLPSGGNQDFSAAPTLRLTQQGLLLTPNPPPEPPRSAESGERLGDNQGGGGQDNAGQPPLLSEPPRPAPAPATPPAQPSPPQVPRQRAAALPRGPAVEQPRTLLTLGLADVTKKSLLGI